MTDIGAMLEARNLIVKRGGVQILDVPMFSIMAGEVISLIGPNGAGKSTLLLSLACLLAPHQGEILFRGQSVMSDHRVFPYRRKIAMVFQEPLLFDATVYENVATGLKIRKMSRAEIRRVVEENLSRFGITHLIGRSARNLSGGEAQRTSLARAFAINPDIIFLDEPFSSLDPPTRDALVGDLQGILKETGTTAVMATHDQLEALRLSDRIAFMASGRIIQTGTPEEVMNHPADEQVASFVGTETIIGGHVGKTTMGTMIVAINGEKIEAVGDMATGTPVLCCIRPEQVILATHNGERDTSVRNAFPGKIVKVIPLQVFYKIVLDCGFPLVAYVTVQSKEDLALAEGMPILASFKATAVHVIRKK